MPKSNARWPGQNQSKSHLVQKGQPADGAELIWPQARADVQRDGALRGSPRTCEQRDIQM